MNVYNPVFKRAYLVVFFMGLAFLSTACNADSALLTVINIKNQKFELFNQQGKCTIKKRGGSSGKVLTIAYPCGFVRTSKKMNAQSYYYKGVGHVYVIAGTPAAKSVYSTGSSVKPEHMCSNEGQAIIINGKNIELRKNKIVALGFCHQLGFDEKDFYGFAYPVD